MATNGNPLIARQGWPLIAVLLALIVAAKVFVGWLPAAVLVLMVLAVVFVFRDPRREVPPVPLAVVSPASGTVASVDKVTDPWLEREAHRCRIHMSLLDVHSLRSPIEGKVMNQWSSKPQEPGIRRRYTYHIRTDEGDDVTLSLGTGTAGLMVRLTLQCGDRIGQGQPCGFLFFAGVIDVYMPESMRMEAKQGDHIDSGTGIIGKLVHKRANGAAKP